MNREEATGSICEVGSGRYLCDVRRVIGRFSGLPFSGIPRCDLAWR